MACLIASVLLGSSLYTMLSSNNSQAFIDYKNSMDPEQTMYFQQVVNQRQNIFIMGTILGLIAGGLFTMLLNGMKSPCMIVAIVLGVQYAFYMLYPKDKWMLDHLRTPEQGALWLNVYQTMMWRSHIGMILGAIGYYFFCKFMMNC